MNTEIEKRGGGHHHPIPKSTIVVVLIVLLLCALMPTVTDIDAPSADEEQYTVDYLADNIQVTLKEGMQSPILISSLDDINNLASNFTVIADVTPVVNGQLGQKTEGVTLELGEYYISLGASNDSGNNDLVFNVLTRTGELYQDTDSKQYSYPNAITVGGDLHVSNLQVTGPSGQIYTGMTDEEVKNLFIVKAVFTDGNNTVTQSIRDYSIDWNPQATGQQNISISYDDEIEDLTITVQDPEFQEIIRLELTDAENDPLMSGYFGSFIESRVTVIADYTDGKLRANSEDYSFSDDLFTKTDKVEGSMMVPVTVAVSGEPGTTFTQKLPVVQSTPKQMSVILSSHPSFVALTGGDYTNVTVYVTFDDDIIPKIMPGDFHFVYIPLDDEGNPKTDISGNEIRITEDKVSTDLIAGSYELIVTFEEADVSLEASAGKIEVSRIELPYPYIVPGTPPTYNGDYRTWQVTSYTNTAIEAVITCDRGHTVTTTGCAYVRPNVGEDGSLTTATLYASHEGTYSVSFRISPNFAQVYEFTTTDVYEVTITQGVPVVSLDVPSEPLVYGDERFPEFSATLSGGTTNVDNVISWNLVEFTFTRDDGVVTSVTGINNIPLLDAGDWSVTVHIPDEASDDLTEATSEPLEFSIGKNKLSVSVTDDDLIYDGNPKEPEVSVSPQEYTNPTIPKDLLVLSGKSSGTNAGDYVVNINVNQNYQRNFQLDVTSYDWRIESRTVDYPSISGKDVYNGQEHTWPIPDFINGDDFRWTIVCSEGSEDDMSVDTEAHLLRATLAGTYTIVFDRIQNENGDYNYAWGDGNVHEGQSVTIAKNKSLQLTVSTTPVKVNGDGEKYDLLYGDEYSLTNDYFTLSYSGWAVEGDNASNQGIQLSLSSDYSRGSLPRTYDVTATFESRNYELQSNAVGHITVGRAPLTMTSATVGSITYLDDAPTIENYSFTFKEFVLGEEFSTEASDNTSGIAFSITTPYGDGPGYSNDADNYQISVDVSEYNANAGSNAKYYIVVTESGLGTLIVNPREVVLDWDYAYTYNGGRHPDVVVNVRGYPDMVFGSYNDTWYQGSGGTRVPISDAETYPFTEGDYSLTLEITDDNYRWDSPNSEDNVLIKTVTFSITYPQVQLDFTLSQYAWDYGDVTSVDTILGWVQSFKYVTSEDDVDYSSIKTEIETKFGSKDFTLTYNNEKVNDILSFGQGQYTFRVLINGFSSFYVYADVDLTVNPKAITIDEFPDKGFGENDRIEYEYGGQEINVGLPSLTLAGGRVAVWTFTIDGEAVATFTGNSGSVNIPVDDVDDYEVTVSVSADSYMFTIGGGGTFTIKISPANIALEPKDPNVTDIGGDALYSGTYDPSGQNFMEPDIVLQEGDSISNLAVTYTVTLKGADGEYNIRVGTASSWDDLMDLIRNANSHDDLDDRYCVTYEMSCTNYEGSGIMYFRIVPAQLSLEITVDGQSGNGSWTFDYDGMNHPVSYTLTGVGGEIVKATWDVTLTGKWFVDGSDVSKYDDTLSYNDLKDVDMVNARVYTISYTVAVDNYVPIMDTMAVTVNRINVGSDDISFKNNGTEFVGSTSMIYGDLSKLTATVGIEDSNYAWQWSLDVGTEQPMDWSGLNRFLGYYESDSSFNYADRGSYTVGYTISDELSNYVPASGSFTVTVEQRTLEVGTPDITYGDDMPSQGELQALVSGYALGEGYSDVFGEGEIGINYGRGNPAGPTGSDGDYAITLPSSNDNYVLSGGNYYTFSVKQFEVVVTIDDKEVQFEIMPTGGLTGTPVAAEPGATIPSWDDVAPYGSIFTLHLEVEKEGSWVKISIEDAIKTRGDYHIVGEPNSNYNVIFKGGEDLQTYGIFHVGPQVIEIKFNGLKFTYDGYDVDKSLILKMFNIPANLQNDAVFAFTYNGGIGDDASPPAGGSVEVVRNAGWYGVTVSFPKDFDYVMDGNTSGTFYISQLTYGVNVMLVDPVDSIIYDGQSHGVTFLVDNLPFTGGTVVEKITGDDKIDESLRVKFRVGGMLYDTMPSFTNVGTYTVEAVFKGSQNFVLPSVNPVTLVITKATNTWMDGGKEIEMLDGNLLPEQYRLINYLYSDPNEVSEFKPKFSGTSEPSVAYYRLVGENSWNPITDGWDPRILPIGTYRVVYSVQEDENYTGLSTEYTFSISRMVLESSWTHGTLPFTGGDVTNTLKWFNRDIVSWSTQGDAKFDDSTGAMTATAEGTYYITLTLKNAVNYAWKDVAGADLVLSWSITSDVTPNEWKTIPSIRNWTFGEAPSTPAGSSQYGDVVFTYYKATASSDTATRDVPDQAGEYVMVATVEGGVQDGVSYGPLSATVGFTIHRAPVALPVVTAVEYTGETVQSPFGGSDLYTVSGQTSGTDIGEYMVTLSLTDDNHCWQDGATDDRNVTWRIVHGGDLLEDYFAVDTTPEVYDGTAHEKSVVSLNPNLQEGRDYVVTYSDNLNAGTATITISAIGERASEPLTYHFLIQKASPVLEFVNEGFDRNEDQGTFTLLPYISSEADGRPVWSSSDTSVAIVDPVTGEVTLVGIGTATITATMPETANCLGVTDSYSLNVGESQTEVIVVPGPGGSGGAGGDVIYIPTVITRNVDGGISDLTWLIILACTVVVMLAIIWLLWNRRVETQ